MQCGLIELVAIESQNHIDFHSKALKFVVISDTHNLHWHLQLPEADVLIHVVDVSHPKFEDQIVVVNKTLEEIKAHQKPTLLVFNKIDKLQEPLKMEDEELDENEPELPYIERLKNTWMAKENAPVIFISATKKTNVEELKQALLSLVKKNMKVTY